MEASGLSALKHTLAGQVHSVGSVETGPCRSFQCASETEAEAAVAFFAAGLVLQTAGAFTFGLCCLWMGGAKSSS